jgi:2-amino-4-hydroxy-6-hydroxymethyldihydropteridine diphosphokinase
MSHIVYLGLGSNLGDRKANLQAAIEGIEPVARLLAASPIYQTPPWGYFAQPDFLNQVIRVETDQSPSELLVYMKDLETRLGRTATVRYGPRTIDIDILFYDDLILDEPGLTIPHPRIQGRAFVLVPLADLAPDMLHPLEGKTISAMLEQVDRSEIALYEE